MREDSIVFLVIAAAALVTYSLRLGGLLLAGRLPKTDRFKRFMDALPGTILLSLIVPAAIGPDSGAGWRQPAPPSVACEQVISLHQCCWGAG